MWLKSANSNSVNPQDSISILPGYVNTIRQDLFYKNNRPKEIKIIDDDSNYVMSATLADIAIFQKIPLKKKIKKITIEIVDVIGYFMNLDTMLKAAARDCVARQAKNGEIHTIGEYLKAYQEIAEILTDAVHTA